MNKKIIIIVVSFLLLVPFRLPISVIFIETITGIATLKGQLTINILSANIVATKLIYNATLSIISIYNIEMLSRSVKGRKGNSGHNNNETDIYWWIVPISVLLVIYGVFDTVTTYDLFIYLNTL